MDFILYHQTNYTHFKNNTMQTFILRERPLNDNTLYIAPERKVFKGGYKAVLKEYQFQNAWTDKVTVKKFRTIETMQKYINKNYTTEEKENMIF